MTRAETEKALRGLRREAVVALEELNQERRQLESLIEFIDQYTGGGRQAGDVQREPMRRTRKA